MPIVLNSGHHEVRMQWGVGDDEGVTFPLMKASEAEAIQFVEECKTNKHIVAILACFGSLEPMLQVAHEDDPY